MTRPLSFRVYDAVSKFGPLRQDPPITELARQLGVSDNSVRQCLMRMTRRGIIERVGIGIYRVPETACGQRKKSLVPKSIEAQGVHR